MMHARQDTDKNQREIVSISTTFFVHLFCTKVFCEALLWLQFCFVIFGTRISVQKRLSNLDEIEYY